MLHQKYQMLDDNTVGKEKIKLCSKKVNSIRKNFKLPSQRMKSGRRIGAFQ